MDIGIYIADLLRKQDEVGLPGLGTFTKERIPGSYDRTSNSFLPPSYKVSFSDKISEFSSLPDYVSFKKHLSPSSAEYFVKKFSSGILDGLETSGIAEVKPLGIIRQESDSLTFEALATFDIAGKFYGLKPIRDRKKTDALPVNEPAIPAAIAGDSSEDFINFQSQEEIENEEESIEESKSNRFLLLIPGAFLFAVLAAGLLYFFNPRARNLVDSMFPKYVSSAPAQADSGNVEKLSPIVRPDSLNTIPQALVRDSSLTDSAASSAPVEKEPEPHAAVTKIEIIGATFKKRSEAEAYVRIMNAKGLSAKIAEDMPGKLFKVSLASFQDDQTAQNELNRIIKEVEKTAWIAKYKSKKTK